MMPINFYVKIMPIPQMDASGSQRVKKVALDPRLRDRCVESGHECYLGKVHRIDRDNLQWAYLRLVDESRVCGTF